MAPPHGSSLVLPGPRGRLALRRYGTEGAPVLFIHGNGGRGSQWEAQLTLLAERPFQSAALDLRGMGASDAPSDGDFSVGGLADDVLAVADHLGFPRFFLVGHSLGASVAACAAARFPHRLLGLVLVDMGGDVRADPPEAIAALVEGLAPAHFPRFAREAAATCLRGARPQVAAQVLADLAVTPQASFAGAVLGLLDFDPVVALAGVAVRKLHLYSPFLDAQALIPIHRRVPGFECRRLEACSHWVHLDQPQTFHQALLRFLETAGKPFSLGRAPAGPR